MSYRDIKTISEFKEFIRNKSVSVVGIGVSNAPLLKFLKNCGVKKIKARDKKNIFEDGGARELQKIQGIKFIFGDNYLDELNEDIIFKTPGIRRDLEPFLNAEREGSILTCEMELFFLLCPAEVIAVTGSEGKSTTATIIGMILKSAAENKKTNGNVYVGGNLGAPLISEVANMKSTDYAVAELSSFQLFDLDNSRFCPDHAIITNITPNHLDWHKDMHEYTEAKKLIYKNQGKTQKTVLNFDCEATRILAEDNALNSTVFFFSKNRLPEAYINGVYCDNGEIFVRTGGTEKKIIDKNDIFIGGEHNLLNFMAAISVVSGISDNETVREAAENFKGVEHRIEFVREYGGVFYYNSSIDSSPSRTITALNYFENFENKGKNIVVILGGYDKKIPFDPLVPAVSKKAKAAVLYGAAKHKIKKTFEASPAGLESLSLVSADDFDSAVKTASELANSGDIVLLSPACSSFDVFKNFEERGNRFKEIVKAF
ncbi:MAG: UDP-N-acetylmuramoyl-L-alanine--D-glutamate ligase [Oscillospiraceae bacterium]|nr:UDP-N-acetylmuramoyl-L-alanine--D-glutamate ligase [Oscillospiraceae bacterium]